MPFSYYQRLSATRKAIYRRSDRIDRVRLPRPAVLQPLATALAGALRGQDPRAVAAICQALTDGILEQLQAPPIRVRVHEVRPRDDYGELHGLYEPVSPPHHSRLSLWMRTAQRGQIVAYRTFLRTLLHELCHHLDYELFGLEESFHTEGFYKRESSLFHQLVPVDSDEA